MKQRWILILLIGSFILVACNLAAPSPPTPTQPALPLIDLIPTVTLSPISVATATPLSTFTATPIPPVAVMVCSDPQVSILLDSFKKAILSADGSLLGSLVSPDGMEVRYYRNGNVLPYTPYQAGFLFETTYEANWGIDPASGIERIGSFHAVIVPELVKIFNQSYRWQCNEIRHGGASYPVTWPYQKDFYSIYFAGTEANGYLDWQTWVVGIEYKDDKPKLYALMQFYWEP